MRLLKRMNKSNGKFQIAVFALIIMISLVSSVHAQDKTGEAKDNRQQTGPMKKTTISVEGMMCMSCVSTVKRKLASLDGVDSVKVNLEGKNASFTYDTRKIDIEKIRQAINDLGYSAGKPETKDK